MALKPFIIAIAALAAMPAIAQTAIAQTIAESDLQTRPLSPSLGGTETLAVVTPEQAEFLIDVPLSVNPNAEDAREDVTLYVLEDNAVKDSGSWTAQDSEACKASGGIELPLPAGRTGCFKL